MITLCDIVQIIMIGVGWKTDANNFIYSMYTGFKPNTSASRTVVSGVGESQLESLQREVDNYTRKLEQEKKKYFSIQDSHRVISKEYETEKNKLNTLKKQSSKAQSVITQARIKNLEAALEKAISTHDETIAYNSKLKEEIDTHRREKKMFIQSQKVVEEEIQRIENDTEQKLKEIEGKKAKAEQLKREIFKIKNKNEQQREQYANSFMSLEKEYIQEKRQREASKFEKIKKPEAIDTQPLLKHRLNNLISSNKNKVRMIEQYKRQMKMIEQAFADIESKSGLKGPQEITETFIKCEQQNCSLYNYMDSLSRKIDCLQKEYEQLQEKIKVQEENDIECVRSLQTTSQQQRQGKQLQSLIDNKQSVNNNLLKLIAAIKPGLQSTLLQLAKSPLNQQPQKLIEYESGMNINERTIEQYLSDLEKYINTLLVNKQQIKPKITNNIKEAVTAYSKPLPEVPETKQQKDKVVDNREENRFMDGSKLREYAMDYWEKRKNKSGKD